jgi:hypothetical protein
MRGIALLKIKNGRINLQKIVDETDLKNVVRFSFIKNGYPKLSSHYRDQGSPLCVLETEGYESYFISIPPRIKNSHLAVRNPFACFVFGLAAQTYSFIGSYQDGGA